MACLDFKKFEKQKTTKKKFNVQAKRVTGRNAATQQGEEENGDYDPSWKSENTEIN